MPKMEKKVKISGSRGEADELGKGIVEKINTLIKTIINL